MASWSSQRQMVDLEMEATIPRARRDPLTVLATVSDSVSGEIASFDDLVGAIAGSLRLHHVAVDVVDNKANVGAFTRVAVLGSDRGGTPGSRSPSPATLSH